MFHKRFFRKRSRSRLQFPHFTDGWRKVGVVQRRVGRRILKNQLLKAIHDLVRQFVNIEINVQSRLNVEWIVEFKGRTVTDRRRLQYLQSGCRGCVFVETSSIVHSMIGHDQYTRIFIGWYRLRLTVSSDRRLT